MLYLEVAHEMMLYSILFCSLIVNSCCESIGVFDDSVLFDISWPGLPKSDALEVKSEAEVTVVPCYTKILFKGLYYSRRIVKMQGWQLMIRNRWLLQL